MPQTTDRNFPWLTEKPIAHRGLFKAGSEREENSLAAIRAAKEKGFAVEIDVRVSADDIVMVFHDDSLERLTDGTGLVSKWGFKQLQQYTVGNTGKGIPTLADIMEEVDGEVPVFIEIKSPPHGEIQQLCAGVRHCFEGYKGPVAVMSFDPRIVAWFKQYMPKYARGVVIGREVLLNWKARLAIPFWLRKTSPDFLACDINLLPNSFCERWRKKGNPLLTWTVRDTVLEEVGNTHADALIFEAPAVVGEDGEDAPAPLEPSLAIGTPQQA
jgi:glycerophosphoryl diester phosphodiesterase